MELQLKTLCYFGLLRIKAGHWSVTSTLTNRTIKIPTSVIVSPSQVKKLRIILLQDYEVKPLIVNSHAYILGGNPIVATDAAGG